MLLSYDCYYNPAPIIRVWETKGNETAISSTLNNRSSVFLIPPFLKAIYIPVCIEEILRNSFIHAHPITGQYIYVYVTPSILNFGKCYKPWCPGSGTCNSVGSLILYDGLEWKYAQISHDVVFTLPGAYPGNSRVPLH